jgi:antitoxin (DNA-binding transcriptional repressor) of toxin-antitoxin stability system
MITKTVEVREAQKRLEELLSWVTTGQEVILTRGDTRIARLVPIQGSHLRVPGLHIGAIWTSDDFDAPLTVY